MNTDIMSGKWKQLKGRIQQKWGDITDDDINKAEGNYEEMLGILQEKYGMARDEAEKELNKITH